MEEVQLSNVAIAATISKKSLMSQWKKLEHANVREHARPTLYLLEI